MKRKELDELTPKQQLEIAYKFESNHTRRDTYGAGDAIEDYRRDDNGVDDMEDSVENNGFTAIRNLGRSLNRNSGGNRSRSKYPMRKINRGTTLR